MHTNTHTHTHFAGSHGKKLAHDLSKSHSLKMQGKIWPLVKILSTSAPIQATHFSRSIPPYPRDSHPALCRAPTTWQRPYLLLGRQRSNGRLSSAHRGWRPGNSSWRECGYTGTGGRREEIEIGKESLPRRREEVCECKDWSVLHLGVN